MKLVISTIVILFAVSKPIECAFSLEQTCKNTSLCFFGTNIACEKPVLIPGAQLIKFSAKEMADIVDLHNKLRNDLATGKVPRLAPAARMGAMAWDTELETMISLNIKRCQYGRDICHNTVNYPMSGQSLSFIKGFQHGTFNRANVIKEINSMINDWFSEYRDADMKIIRNLQPDGIFIHEFLGMSSEANTRVGCAVVWYPEDGTGRVNFGCNYATMPIRGQAVYLDGPNGSRCQSGRDTKYTGLCSVNEKY